MKDLVKPFGIFAAIALLAIFGLPSKLQRFSRHVLSLLLGACALVLFYYNPASTTFICLSFWVNLEFEIDRQTSKKIRTKQNNIDIIATYSIVELYSVIKAELEVEKITCLSKV